MLSDQKIPGYRFPVAIIGHAVWLYHRFTLSYRDVEELLAERGIIVTNRGKITALRPLGRYRWPSGGRQVIFHGPRLGFEPRLHPMHGDECGCRAVKDLLGGVGSVAVREAPERLHPL